MPEAHVLAAWLSQNAAAFGLADTAVPDDATLHHATRRGVAVGDWRKIGVALEAAGTCLPERQDVPIDCWLAAITETVALDPLEAEILALALHYQLDQRGREAVRFAERLSRQSNTVAPGRGANRSAAERVNRRCRCAASVRREAASERPAASSARRGLEVLERLTALLRRTFRRLPICTTNCSAR